MNKNDEEKNEKLFLFAPISDNNHPALSIQIISKRSRWNRHISYIFIDHFNPNNHDSLDSFNTFACKRWKCYVHLYHKYTGIVDAVMVSWIPPWSFPAIWETPNTSLYSYILQVFLVLSPTPNLFIRSSTLQLVERFLSALPWLRFLRSVSQFYFFLPFNFNESVVVLLF